MGLACSCSSAPAIVKCGFSFLTNGGAASGGTWNTKLLCQRSWKGLKHKGDCYWLKYSYVLTICNYLLSIILGFHSTSRRPCWCIEQFGENVLWKFDSRIMQDLSHIWSLFYNNDGLLKIFKNSTLVVKYIWIYKYTLNIKKSTKILHLTLNLKV